MAKGFTAPQVSELLGIPYATLDSWVRNQFFVPSLAQAQGRGSRRLYSFFDVLILGAVTKLRTHGVNTDLLQNLISNMRNYQNQIETANAKQVIVFGENIFGIHDKNEGESGDFLGEELYIVIPIGMMGKILKFRMMHSQLEEIDADHDSKVKVV